MIQLTPHMRIFMAVEPVDFRRGIDGLCRTVREIIKEDPFSGYMFVFYNKRRTSIKILFYDGQGFCLFQKRLSTGRFRHFKCVSDQSKQSSRRLEAYELQVALVNGDIEHLKAQPQWRPILSDS